MTILRAFLLAVFVAGCAARTPSHGAPPPPAGGSDDIREAVFRHLFQKNASGQQGGATVYCLQVEGKKDPGPALMARFRQHTPPVVPASACTVGPEGVRETATGKQGLLLRIDEIRKKGANQAEVNGGYFEAGLSASGNLYELSRENGRWVVRKDTMLWISQARDYPEGATSTTSDRMTAAMRSQS